MNPTRLIIAGDLYAGAAAVLIVLRCQLRLDWPWLWILAPFWAPAVLAACAALIIALTAAIEHIVAGIQAQPE